MCTVNRQQFLCAKYCGGMAQKSILNSTTAVKVVNIRCRNTFSEESPDALCLITRIMLWMSKKRSDGRANLRMHTCSGAAVSISLYRCHASRNRRGTDCLTKNQQIHPILNYFLCSHTFYLQHRQRAGMPASLFLSQFELYGHSLLLSCAAGMCALPLPLKFQQLLKMELSFAFGQLCQVYFLDAQPIRAISGCVFTRP